MRLGKSSRILEVSRISRPIVPNKSGIFSNYLSAAISADSMHTFHNCADDGEQMLQNPPLHSGKQPSAFPLQLKN
jgi:hypothetical protein